VWPSRLNSTLFTHCVQAQRRTPTVAALYVARLRGIGIDEAMADVIAVLPNAPIPQFCEALHRLHPAVHETADD
jgi:hypothetical protein